MTLICNCITNRHIRIVVVIMINFTISVTIIATAQFLFIQNIVIIWLETNKTKISSTPVIMVSEQDFWRAFGPLLEQSINGSTSSFE